MPYGIFNMGIEKSKEFQVTMSKGRPKTDVWKHFVEVKEDNATCARCKNCGHEMVNNAERLKAERLISDYTLVVCFHFIYQT